MKRTSRHRRRFLATLAALGARPLLDRGGCLAAATTAPAPFVPALDCVLTPAMTKGPFFIDEKIRRSDLTTGTTRAGVVNGLPLMLDIDVRSASSNNCAPLAGMQIDVWHADAHGEYSDVARGGGQSSTQGQTFLRGFQISDANGHVGFRTIYPGWYPGRTIHIHVIARAFDAAGNTTFAFASQLFFDDAANDRVMANAPYNLRGARSVRNLDDDIYDNFPSARVRLQASADGARGYRGAITLGLNARG